jgi:hypothetical protein
MAGQGSARVTLREIDLSQVRNPQELPQGVPAAVVGPARKGPAFVPQTFANMQQFNETFGSMIENTKESNSNLFGPLALNEWMKNSRAGTYIRVLGTGNGLKSDSGGKVTDAGFRVGEQLVHEVGEAGQVGQGPGKVSANPHANMANADDATDIARTHMLGCFMKDSPGSRLLCDAGVQAETNAAEIPTDRRITFNTAENGDTLQIFIPKELINSSGAGAVTEDVTLTVVVKTEAEVYTAIPKDTIQLEDVVDATLATNLLAALAVDETAGTTVSSSGTMNADNANSHGDVGKDWIFSSLSFNPSDLFDTTGSAGVVVALKLPAGKEGDEAFIVETAGTLNHLIPGTTALNEKVFFTGAAMAAPVIRGVLMAPQGIVPSLNPAAALHAVFSHVGPTVGGTLAVEDDVRRRADLDPADADKTYGAAPASNLIGYQVGEVDSKQSFKLILNGFKNAQKPFVLDCSFDPDSPSYISKVLNTDPTKIEECGHYLYAHWDVKADIAIPANDALSKGDSLLSENASDSAFYQNMIGFLVAGAAGRNTSSANKPNYESFESRYQTACTPWIVSQFFSKNADTSPRPLTAKSGEAFKLFKLHALDDGKIGNHQYRVLVENIRYSGESEYGIFDMTLEKFNSDAISGQPVASWKNLTLDPNSRNFIARVIGTKHTYYDFDKELNRQRIKESGQYALKNKFVRVELSSDVKNNVQPIESVPTGFQSHSYLFTGADGNFIESADIGIAGRVFTNAADDKVTETLSKAQILPLDFVKSINRVSGSGLEADADLAWGVKFGLRENRDDSNRELVEQVFNRSISSWSKYYPALDSNPALRSGDDADGFQKSMFSLEKIIIPSTGLSADEITSWDGAIYERRADVVSPITGGRYVRIEKDANGSNVRYLKFRCMFQGGFDGVNIFDKEKSDLTGVASLRESQDETGSSKFTGPTVMSYRRAVDVLSDKSAAEFQLLAIPGQKAPSVTDYAITACEDRFDAMLLIDIVSRDAQDSVIEDSLVKPSVRRTIKDFSNRVLNTSFAAAYFPDVLIRRPSDRAPIVVPPSVGMLGVMSRNDAIADPWFAPAGLERGRIVNAFDSQVQMNRDLLDELYDADINPIYVPAGRSGEVYAFGQKTLLQDQSALDRINVRRLLIDIRRKVKKIGEQLLFEPNRESTLKRFSSLVEPIMSSVQKRRGVVRYKVQIDTTTTTQNDVENNTIRGKIYLQPTKTIEFISLDFIVTNTIQD